MSTSQFTIYTSSDLNGPGLLTGQTGSLIKLLDACLINGYTSKSAAGWTRPLPTISASAGGAPCLACYKQGSGSGLTLFINDCGPNTTAGSREAWACGFESIVGLTGSIGSGVIFTGSYGNGTGNGQFPTPAQSLTTGHLVWRKSTTNDTAGRQWILFADASTLYIFMSSADTTGAYMSGWFGDLFSLAGSADLYKCMIQGRTVENSGVYNNETVGSCSALSAINGGLYVARTWGGGGFSTQLSKQGDLGLSVGSALFDGLVPTPNGTDSSLYIAPIRAGEYPSQHIRGRFRGLFQCCHPKVSFSDGQVISGAGDYAGKVFQSVIFVLDI